jgi:ABC-type multidrug transport system ATPase subunit
MLKLKSHSVRVGFSGVEIIRNLDLGFADNCCHCLVGINGVGKTSLLLSLTKRNALLDSNGTWQPAAYFSPRELIATESVTVRQFAALFRPSLALAYWGLSSVAGQSVQSLSQGEKTKLTLGIAEAMDPRVLLLDEPSLGLEMESQVLLGELIRQRVSACKTTIVSTHDLSALNTQECRILYLYREGGITKVAEGEDRVLEGSADVQFRSEPPRRLEGSAAMIARRLLEMQIGRFR